MLAPRSKSTSPRRLNEVGRYRYSPPDTDTVATPSLTARHSVTLTPPLPAPALPPQPRSANPRSCRFPSHALGSAPLPRAERF
ncbi:hypothetical protein BaRGS_00030322 [Batillaria attramentaria]|uniref:Uncharacterized protein n=1 Tax=Batillaria attramentaria TaxID=370345 RepID=A0ABD0JUS9_9CAEN